MTPVFKEQATKQVKLLAQGHTASKWLCWVVNPDSLALRAMLLTIPLCCSPAPPTKHCVLRVLHVLFHVNHTMTDKVGHIFIPILQMGKLRHRW